MNTTANANPTDNNLKAIAIDGEQFVVVGQFSYPGAPGHETVLHAIGHKLVAGPANAFSLPRAIRYTRKGAEAAAAKMNETNTSKKYLVYVAKHHLDVVTAS
jgi:hypothetical protein